MNNAYLPCSDPECDPSPRKQHVVVCVCERATLLEPFTPPRAPLNHRGYVPRGLEGSHVDSAREWAAGLLLPGGVVMAHWMSRGARALLRRS